MLTDKIAEVAQALVDHIRTKNVELDLQNKYTDEAKWGVFFGEERGGFPHLPVICVEPNVKQLRQSDAGNIKRPYFDIQVMIFHCDALQSDTLTRKAALERAETLWNILDNARNLNGIIVQGWVTSLEAGFSNDGRGKLLHAHRLTWQGQSRMLFPQGG